MENKELKSLQTFLNENWQEVTWIHDAFETEDGLRFENVDEIIHDSSHWYTPISVITKGPSGQHYSWGWERGNTEMQDNDRYDDKVYTVRPKEIVTVTWVSDTE